MPDTKDNEFRLDKNLSKYRMKNLKKILPEKYFVVVAVEISKRVKKADLDKAAVEK